LLTPRHIHTDSTVVISFYDKLSQLSIKTGDSGKHKKSKKRLTAWHTGKQWMTDSHS